MDVTDGLELPPLRLAQDDKRIAEIPPRINLRNLCVSAVVLFKSEVSYCAVKWFAVESVFVIKGH